MWRLRLRLWLWRMTRHVQTIPADAPPRHHVLALLDRPLTVDEADRLPAPWVLYPGRLDHMVGIEVDTTARAASELVLDALRKAAPANTPECVKLDQRRAAQ